jgi:hypothetical protein
MPTMFNHYKSAGGFVDLWIQQATVLERHQQSFLTMIPILNPSVQSHTGRSPSRQRGRLYPISIASSSAASVHAVPFLGETTTTAVPGDDDASCSVSSVRPLRHTRHTTVPWAS